MSGTGRRYEGLGGGLTRLADDWEVIASFFIPPTGSVNSARRNGRHREGILKSAAARVRFKSGVYSHNVGTPDVGPLKM